ncbi:ANTH-domain-containing protein, partial [Martensiomyces pterosporus]
SSMEKAVFKATRKDAVHPKQKHVDTLIQMTWSGASMEELFMLVQDRFSEANWVISFKALIVVHIVMHEGNGPLIYDYLIHHPNALDMTRFRDRHGTKGVSAFEQSKNVRTYASYLNDKVLAYKAIRIDHVSEKNPAGSQIYAKATSDVKFLLLEVSTVQKQLHSVLKNRFDSDTFDNETTFSAFRYCLRDMLKLFQVMNLGVMKMLKIYFEVPEDDMRRSLDLYKRFVKLTDRADEYLKIARRFESIFGFSIPNLTHAPLSLSKALEDFLEMP